MLIFLFQNRRVNMYGTMSVCDECTLAGGRYSEDSVDVRAINRHAISSCALFVRRCRRH